MITLSKVSFSYGSREVLRGLDLRVEEGEIFGFLGPNGCGKTTLFKILSTYFVPAEGQVLFGETDIVKESKQFRSKIGVVFQSPSLDPQLSVSENIKHQGNLYGLDRKTISARTEELLGALDLKEHSDRLVRELSGGLKRRAELVKSILHEPKVLIMDEPSTGLDPKAKRVFWDYLIKLREEKGMTVLVTTHDMEEAEKCNRVAIMEKGEIIALDEPRILQNEIGADVLEIRTQSKALKDDIEERFSIPVREASGKLFVEHPEGHRFLPDLIEAFPGEIDEVRMHKPTLEDVFLHKTGHSFWGEAHE